MSNLLINRSHLHSHPHPHAHKVLQRRTLQYKRMYALQDGKCFYCQAVIPRAKITKDHFYPKSWGFSLSYNTILACDYCNQVKSNYSIRELRHRLQQKIKNISGAGKDAKWKKRKYKRILITCNDLLHLNNLGMLQL